MISVDNKDYSFKIGQNASENWQIFDQSYKNDIWIHVDGLPSAHGILHIVNKNNVKKLKIIKKISNILKEISNYKNVKYLNIIYTPVINLKKGIKQGEMIIHNRSLVKTLVI